MQAIERMNGGEDVARALQSETYGVGAGGGRALHHDDMPPRTTFPGSSVQPKVAQEEPATPEALVKVGPSAPLAVPPGGVGLTPRSAL